MTGEASEEREEWIKDGLLDYMHKWETELQRTLGELQLLASPAVAELADRVSDALLEITAPVELRGDFDDYYWGFLSSRDLVRVLLNAMREELGLPPAPLDGPFGRDDNWPWLDEPPSADYYAKKRATAQARMAVGSRSVQGGGGLSRRKRRWPRGGTRGTG